MPDPIADADCLGDVAGLLVGHHQRRGRGWRTGTTVVLVPPGATAGCDVRGGGPGTRETDLLRPEATIETVHAVCLTGGSAYGLAAADGVMTWLAERHVGFPVGPLPHQVVPIVPAAVIFDLGRGGSFAHRPDASFGHRAATAARARGRSGSVGAGTGAVAGGLQGGVGCASVRLPSGLVVGALAVVNSSGSVIDPATSLPWVTDGTHLRRPPPSERRALGDHLERLAAARLAPPLNTTIGVVATTARLSTAECSKLAAVAHDGLARAIRPAHSTFDGDTVFALATGADELPAAEAPAFRAPRSRAAAFDEVLRAGADCFARACTRAVLEAASVPGGPPSYRDLCPGAFSRSR